MSLTWGVQPETKVLIYLQRGLFFRQTETFRTADQGFEFTLRKHVIDGIVLEFNIRKAFTVKYLALPKNDLKLKKKF